MALDCTLTCYLNTTESELDRTLSREYSVIIVKEDEVRRFSMPGLHCAIISASPLTKELTAETFGFLSTVKLVFRFDKFDHYSIGVRNFCAICINLMRVYVGDCVLSVEDIPHLIRKDARIIIKSQHGDAWEGVLLSIAKGVGGPFEVVSQI